MAKKRSGSSPDLTVDAVKEFEKTEAQLEGFFGEIGLIAKKKPDDPLNLFKLKFINQMLESANSLLGEDYMPFPDFSTFDVEGTIPTASDAVVMLSQYLRSMDQFRNDHTEREHGTYYWVDLPGRAKIEARRPKNFDK